MKFSVFFVLSLVLAASFSLELSSWANHEEKIAFADNQSHPYQIFLARSQTDTPYEPYHCKASGRTIGYNKSEELFRLDTHLSKSLNRQESVLKNLLYLNLDEEILNFEVSNEDYYVITSLNKIYYLKHDKGDKYFDPAETYLPETAKESVEKSDFFLLVIQGGVAIILGNEAFACHGTQCSYISGWESIPALTHATYTKTKQDRQYIMIAYLTGFSVMEYSGTGMVSGVHKFDHTFFNKSSVNIYDINPDGVNESEIYILDYEEGVYLAKYQNNDPTRLVHLQLVLNVSRCFSMDNVGYKYFILICRSPLDESDYLIEVHYNEKDQKFIGTVPDNQQFQKIVDVVLTPNYYVSWARSGFKFYWMSTNKQYPQQYRKAGHLMLYNTVQGRFKTFNNKNYLYYATPSSIHRLEIGELSPYVSCISSINTKEKYQITYAVECQDDSQRVCTKSIELNYEATRHQQISLMFGVFPLILSFLGVILITVLIVVIFCDFKKKEKQILDKTESFEVTVDDLGMVAPNSARV